MGGGDKTLQHLVGRSLLDHVVERLAPQCPAGLILNTNSDPAQFANFPGAVIPDCVAGHPGPLAGILAGLDHVAQYQPDVSHIISAPGDTPFLPRDLVARLQAVRSETAAPIVVAASGGRDHYIVALWSVNLREPLRAALVERGERRAGRFVAEQGYARAMWPSDPVDPFLNINDPEDLAAAATYRTPSSSSES